MNVATSYFQNLLGSHQDVNDFFDDIDFPDLSVMQADYLMRPFNRMDLQLTLEKMAKSKTPGPDDFPT